MKATQRRRQETSLRAAAPEAAPTKPEAEGELVLGVDPSLRGTGYGVIRASAGKEIELMAQGVVKCPAAWPRTRCLAAIAAAMRELTRRFALDACAVEGLFYAQNQKTALIMGEARGAALAVLAEAGAPVYELAPRRVKQAIVGHGGAAKEAVARMVQRMLRLPEPPPPDAADALALALVFVHEQKRSGIASGPKRI
ncbi:MAG: crossover junction endodeoxyribonuclease RuvC [Verrucomicrobia bacterium]|nr:crossover junction endodeoxyribonuclease RuvC [Verrucomicrobiota bacterium]